jgi:hypothetical protein
VLEAEDRVHPPGQDRRWRESYYFSFYDERHGIGGFTSVGKRAATGNSGSINVLWGPERESLVASEFDTFATLDDDHHVAGLTYRARESFGVWEITFDGRLNSGGSGVECDHAALGPARDGAVSVRYELTFTPSAPPYGYRQSPEWSELFTGHVDEVGTVRGTVTVGGRTYDIDGRGGKDHSWGVRNWFAPKAWRWFDLVSTGPELTLWRAAFQPGNWVGDGAVFLDGQLLPLEDYTEELSTVEVPGRPKPLSSKLDATLRAGGREFAITGEVRRVLPVLFTRKSDDLVSWNDRALVECTIDGARAWANVEFAELVGSP